MFDISWLWEVPPYFCINPHDLNMLTVFADFMFAACWVLGPRASPLSSLRAGPCRILRQAKGGRIK